eukprot:12903421-Prorocentrum_lima.AAC.1
MESAAKVGPQRLIPIPNQAADVHGDWESLASPLAQQLDEIFCWPGQRPRCKGWPAAKIRMVAGVDCLRKKGFAKAGPDETALRSLRAVVMRWKAGWKIKHGGLQPLMLAQRCSRQPNWNLI